MMGSQFPRFADARACRRRKLAHWARSRRRADGRVSISEGFGEQGCDVEQCSKRAAIDDKEANTAQRSRTARTHERVRAQECGGIVAFDGGAGFDDHDLPAGLSPKTTAGRDLDWVNETRDDCEVTTGQAREAGVRAETAQESICSPRHVGSSPRDVLPTPARLA
jgi:hypothetical protein